MGFPPLWIVYTSDSLSINSGRGHIGAAWLDGQYARTRDPGHFRHFFEDLMERLQTDYIDIGMVHFVDTPEEWDLRDRVGIRVEPEDIKIVRREPKSCE